LAQIGISIADLEDLVFVMPGISNTARNFLVGSDGTIFSSVGGDYSVFLSEKFDLQSRFPPGQNVVEAPGFTGIPAYIVKTPVSGTNWFIITTETVEAVK